MIPTICEIFPLGDVPIQYRYNHCGYHYGQSHHDANNSITIREFFEMLCIGRQVFYKIVEGFK